MTGQGNKMEIIEKAHIIIQFTEEFRGVEKYDEFFEYNDMGVPLSIALANDFIILTDGGRKIIEETFEDICWQFEADPNGEYENLEDLIDSTYE